MQTQYGFRPKKSTSHAICVARRLQDIAEESRSRSTLILLDWEKAFDRVAQEKVIETLKRLLVPNRICNLVASFYQNPEFKVKVASDNSDWTSQRAGPYWTVYSTPDWTNWWHIFLWSAFCRWQTDFWRSEKSCINVLLHAIERHSEYFGLKLNYDKCINITANQRVSSVCFPPTGPGQGKLVPIEKVLQLTLAQFYPIHSVIRQNFWTDWETALRQRIGVGMSSVD